MPGFLLRPTSNRTLAGAQFMPGCSKIYSDIVLFGIRVQFEYYEQHLFNTALSLYSDWIDPLSPSGGPSVRVLLTTCELKKCGLENHRVEGRLLTATQDGIDLYADANCASGACIFPAEGASPDRIIDAIETVVLFLVAQSDRTPIHASAFMMGNKAFVMAGKSGSGKSSLAYAAQRLGLRVLAEDTVFVQTTPRFRLWGWPRAIHLLESDAPKDAEGAIRLRAGRRKLASPVANSCRWAEKSSLCLIERGREVTLETIEVDEALRILTREPEPGYDFYGARSIAAIRAVAAGGCRRLSLSDDPVQAISTLIDVALGSDDRCLL